MSVIGRAKFLKDLMPALYQLAWLLYDRFKGDVSEARREISRIPDYWEDYEEQKERIKRELEELKSQGK